MYFNNCGNSSINKTFILEPLSVTGDTPTLSACTTMYTNLLESCSGDTTIQLGTGLVSFNSNVDGVNSFSANTIEASTYYSGGTNLLDIFSSTDTYVTGGTFSDVGDSLSLVRNDGANVIITGITNFFTTGGTYDNNTNLIYFDRNDQLSAFTVDLSTIDVNDTFSTGGTYNTSTDTITISRNDGGSFEISGITDYYTTGATLIGAVVYFDREDVLSAYTADLSALEVNDTFVSAFTRDGNVITIERNDGVDLPLDISEIVFSGGSGNCITDLYVTNIHGCSPITFHDNIQLETGVTITSISGDSALDLRRNGVDDNFKLSGGRVRVEGLTNVLDVNAGNFVTDTQYSNFVMGANGIALSLIKSDFSKISVIGIISNDTSPTTTSNLPSYPIYLAAQNATMASGITNTVVIGGNGINATQSDTVYTDNLNLYGTPTTANTETDILVRNASGDIQVRTLDSISASLSANTYVTGQTFNNSTYELTTTRNDAASFVTDLSILSSDMVVTGGTYDINTGIVEFTNNSGGTFQVSGFTSGMTDSYTTSATLNGSVVEFNNNLQGANYYNVDLEPALSAKTDVVLFNSHTADTSNPHQTTFSALTSTAHTHTMSDIIGLTTALGGYLPLSGGTMSGAINFGSTGVTLTNDGTAFNLFADDDSRFRVGLSQWDINTDGDLSIINDYTGPTRNANIKNLAGQIWMGDGTNFGKLDFNVGNIGTGQTWTLPNNTGIIALQSDLDPYALQTDLVTHTGDTNNPHNVTIEQVSGVSETVFNTYTGNTDTLIGTKLDTSIFNNYTATTVDNNYYATGGTYNSGTESIDFSGNNVSANFTVDVSALLDDTNTFITGFTYDDANTLTIVRNDLASFSVAINTMTGLTVDGIISATTMSANTYYGDGSNLTGISTANDYTTGVTVDVNTLYFDRTDALSAYTVDLTGLANLPTDREFQLFGNQSSTGIIYTDGLSVSSDNTKFDLGDTKGWIVDNTTDPENPVTQYVHFSASTGITVTDLGTQPVTYVGLTGNTPADIVQSSEPFGPETHRDILELGVVIHSDNIIVNVVNNLPSIGIDPTSQLYDLIYSLGYFNLDLAGQQGNVYSAGSGMTMDKTSGDIFAQGSNYENDPKNPHVKTLSSGTSITFRYRLSDSTEYANTTELEPNIYENAGVTAATPTNKFTVQRIVMFPSGIARLQYGQNIYDSIDDAEASLSTEPFIVEDNMKENGLLRGFVILKEGTTDLSDSTSAKFILSNHFGHANDTVVGNVHRTEIVNSSSTGIREGGEVTVNGGDSTLFDISSGTGIIVNNFTNPTNPSLIQVDWSDYTGQTATYLTGETFTYLTMDEGGNIIQTAGSVGLTPAQKRSEIVVGGILHPNSSILFAWDRQIPFVSPVNHIEDLTTSIGTFAINGNRITSIVNTLNLEKSVGESFYFGGFNVGTPQSPNITTNSNLSATTLVYAKGDDIMGPSGTTIDVDNYDPNGDGTITAISPNSFVAHRIWHQPTENVLIFQYGQFEYNNLEDAKVNFALEDFTTPKIILEESYLVSVIICREGETDLDNAARSQVIPQGKFAGTGGGGVTPDTLQSAYNNSITPEIVTDVTRGAVSFKRGTAADTDIVVEVLNGSNDITSFIRGDGYLSASTVDGIAVFENGSNINTIYNTIAQFDSHTGDTNNPHNVTVAQLSGVSETLFNTYTGDTATALNTKLENGNNLGSGEGLYTGKTGTDFWLKSIASSGGSVTVTSDATTINIEVPADNNTFVTGGTTDTGGTITLTRNDDVEVVIDNKEVKRYVVTDGFDITAGVAYLGTSGAKFLSFDGGGTSDEQGSFNFAVPSDYVSGGTFYIKFTTLATANDIQFEMNITSRNNGEDISTPTDTAIQNATTGAGTSWDMVETAAYSPSSSTFSADKNVMVRLNRDASDAPDTYTGVAYVWGIVFEYTGIK